MDATDRKILKQLAANARLSLKELAADACLSSPAASARLERLQKTGVIRGYQAQLDHQALGYPILAFVSVAIPPDRRAEFKTFAQGCPNILEAHHITGNYSVILKAAFATTQALEAFVGHLQAFGTTQTQVVFSSIIEPRQILEG